MMSAMHIFIICYDGKYLWIQEAAFFELSAKGGFHGVKNWIVIYFKSNSELLNWLLVK